MAMTREPQSFICKVDALCAGVRYCYKDGKEPQAA